MRLVTMGVYGFDASTFRAALERAKVDVFVDTRRRRGVLGHEYAFANSQRLQGFMAELAIPYVHRIDLAPSEAAIHTQDAAGHAASIPRRDRDHFSDAFREAYQRDVL